MDLSSKISFEKFSSWNNSCFKQQRCLFWMTFFLPAPAIELVQIYFIIITPIQRWNLMIYEANSPNGWKGSTLFVCYKVKLTSTSFLKLFLALWLILRFHDNTRWSIRILSIELFPAKSVFRNPVPGFRHQTCLIWMPFSLHRRFYSCQKLL